MHARLGQIVRNTGRPPCSKGQGGQIIDAAQDLQGTVAYLLRKDHEMYSYRITLENLDGELEVSADRQTMTIEIESLDDMRALMRRIRGASRPESKGGARRQLWIPNALVM